MAAFTQKMAEKAAWSLARENGIDLVTINPIFVFGPVVSKRKEATSVSMTVVRSLKYYKMLRVLSARFKH